MKTFKRACLENHTETDAVGRILNLKAGEVYLTSEEKDGQVTVFTTIWAVVPVSLFGTAVQFTGEKLCS